jgi:hypothetical protein
MKFLKENFYVMYVIALVCHHRVIIKIIPNN